LISPDRGDARGIGCYADVPNRLAALLVDAILLTVLIFAAAVVTSVLIGPAVEFDSGSESLSEAVRLDRGVAIVDAVLSLLISAAYFTVSWVRWGATPGQRLLRVWVDGEGASLGGRRALIRWALLGGPFAALAILITAAPELDNTLPDLAVAAWYLILLVSTARGGAGQGLHDRIAGSVVVMRATPIAAEHTRPDAH